MEEIWKSIPRYSGYYEASSLGRIKSLSRTGSLYEFILSGFLHSKGYIRMSLGIGDGNHYTEFRHILVAEAFTDPADYKHKVIHIDKDITNDEPTNLKWMWSDGNKISQHPKTIYQYDLQDNLIKEWIGIKETCRTLNLDRWAFYRHLDGPTKSYKGFIFKRIKL